MVISSNDFLLEFEYALDDGVYTAYLTSGEGYVTSEESDPAGRVYLPLVIDMGSIEGFLFGRDSTTSGGSISGGRITLNNAKGTLDFLLYAGIDGRPFRIRQRYGELFPTMFPVVFSGTVVDFTIDDTKIQLTVRSLVENIRSQQLLTTVYEGTNDNATEFLEGDENLRGQPKPLILGNGLTANIAPVLVNEIHNIYQLSVEPISTLQDVYIGRTPQTLDTVFAAGELNDFVSTVTTAPPPAAEYFFYAGDYGAAIGSQARGAYIALGTTPTKRVTVNAAGAPLNLMRNSEDFSLGDYTNLGVTVTPAATGIVSNELFLNRVRETTGVSQHVVSQQITYPSATGIFSLFAPLWISCIVKRSTARYIKFGMRALAVDEITQGAIFDMQTLSLVEARNFDPSRFFIEQIEADTYRLQFRCEFLDVTYDRFFFGLSNGTFTNYEGSTSRQIFMGAVQVTCDAEAPIYIPSGATQGRAETATHAMEWLLRRGGYSFEIAAKLRMMLQARAATGDYITDSSKTLGTAIDSFADAVKGYWDANDDGTFTCSLFRLPTSSEVVQTFDTPVLLGRPRVVRFFASDPNSAIPPYRIKIGWGQNYTIQNEDDVFGAVEVEDVPFTSQRFRYLPRENEAIREKHLNSTEWLYDSLLRTEAGAEALGNRLEALYSYRRPCVRIRVPYSLAVNVQRGNVIRVENKLYRVIGKRVQFPTTGRSNAVSNVIQLTAWGGIDG